MNSKAKKLWVADLRSGKYKQATGVLRDTTNGRCCLGVLCDVFRRATGKGRWRRGNGEWEFTIDGQTEEFILPEPVREWAELKGQDPFLTSNERNRFGCNAGRLNDSGKSFKEIADRIEKYL